MLTNVMLYWLTGTAGSSALLYYENARSKGRFRPGAAPVGVAVFPHDIQLPVCRFAELQYTVVHWTEFDRGGHFAALEVPDLFVEDVREIFPPLPVILFRRIFDGTGNIDGLPFPTPWSSLKKSAPPAREAGDFGVLSRADAIFDLTEPGSCGGMGE